MYQHRNSDNLVELTDWKPKIEKEDTLSDLFQYWIERFNRLA